MATNIFDKPFSDHVVFDRIVDADRNITLARQAADKAEADGKPDKAAALRAKADQLEALLNATKQPTYDDVDETESQGPDPTKTPSDDDQQGKGGDGSGGGQAPNNNQDQSGTSATVGNGSTDGADQGQDQGGSTQRQTDSSKTPDDISNIDQNSGSHANGTLKSGQGGPGESSGSGSSSGSGGSSQGQGQGQNQNNSNNSGNSNGSGKSTNKQKELDPFKRSLGGNNQQGEQPTPQQILDAIIKRLSGLSGNAKVGADKALQQLYGELGGSGAIDD